MGVAVAYDAPAMVQTIIGYISLVVIFGVGIYAVMKKQNYHRVWVIPCVGTWASFAIASELSSPRDKIVATFSGSVIANTEMASKVVACLLLLVMAVQLARSVFFEKENIVQDEQGGENEEQYSSLN